MGPGAEGRQRNEESQAYRWPGGWRAAGASGLRRRALWVERGKGLRNSDSWEDSRTRWASGEPKAELGGWVEGGRERLLEETGKEMVLLFPPDRPSL